MFENENKMFKNSKAQSQEAHDTFQFLVQEQPAKSKKHIAV